MRLSEVLLYILVPNFIVFIGKKKERRRSDYGKVEKCRCSFDFCAFLKRFHVLL